MKKLLSIIYLVCLTGICCAQTYSLSDFIKSDPPGPYTDKWYPLNNSPAYHVSLNKGKLQISKYQADTIPTARLQQGELIGINMGEFGGSLYYKPNDTVMKTALVNGKPTVRHKYDDWDYPVQLKKMTSGAIPLISAQPLRFFRYRDSLYLLDGIAHMGTNHGNIYSITERYGVFKISTILHFDERPFTMDFFRKKIYLATFSSFYILKNMKPEKIVSNQFWSGLYPNSIAIKDRHHVYMGINSGYVLLDPVKKSVTFYKYNK